MGTSSAIGMKMEDGGVRAIRCNWDGYVAGVGAILGGWYTDAAKIEKLLALGDLSRLGTKIAPEPGTTHTFAHPQPDVTVAYHRDRGERMKSTRRYANVEAYRRDGKGDFGADYLYLFADGKWHVYGLVGKEEFVKISGKKQNADFRTCGLNFTFNMI